MEKVFTSVGIFVDREIRVESQEHNAHGRADFIIELNNEKVVVELKTTGQSKFEELEQTNKPDKYHYYQIQMYLYLLKIDKGIILYECKNNSKLKEFAVTLDRDCINKIWENFKSAKSYIDSNTLPDRDFARNTTECGFCPFSEKCYVENWI